MFRLDKNLDASITSLGRRGYVNFSQVFSFVPFNPKGSWGIEEGVLVASHTAVPEHMIQHLGFILPGFFYPPP